MSRYITFFSTTACICYSLHLNASMEQSQFATSMMALPDEGNPLEDMHKLQFDNFDESDLDVITDVGACYLHDHGLPQNVEKAYQYFVFAAKRGHAQAQYYLGYCCDVGIVIRNPYIAFDCFKRAAQQGHVEAQSNLADCFFYGRGTKQDNAQALHWYLQAASHSDTHAKRMLAQCFAHDLCSRDYLPTTAPWSLIAAVHERLHLPAPTPAAATQVDVGLAGTVFAQAMEN
jgi:TPR repeat protein